MSPEKFNCFYRINIKRYEKFLSEIKADNEVFSHQEKALNKVYYHPGHFIDAHTPEYMNIKDYLFESLNKRSIYFESLKMIEYFGINDNNPIPKCDLKSFTLSENISKNTKGRMRHFYDILCRIHNEIERFKSFKFDCYPESFF